jgi:hypothetical protein
MNMSIIAFVVGAAIVMDSKPPKWFTPLLAGYALDIDESHTSTGVFDKAKGYYIVRSDDCDGAYISLTLTKDRHVVQSNGFGVPSLSKDGNNRMVKERPLPSLQTGNGVTIGDSAQQVRDRLGKPSKVKEEGSRKQFDVLSYLWKTKERGYKCNYDQEYVFKEGKLIEIRFLRSMD